MTASDAVTDAAPATTAPPDSPPRRRAWLASLAWWLVLPVALWLGVTLLLAPPPGGSAPGDQAVASATGIVLLMAQPIALAVCWRRRRDRPLPRRALAGLVWVVLFAAIAALTQAVLLWHGSWPDADLPWRMLAFWFAWGGLWLGLLVALAGARVPGIAAQVLVSGLAIAAASSLLWLNDWLIANEGPGLPAAIQTVVTTSPMHAWLNGVLGQQIFRQGRFYLNPDGEPLSMIGDHLSGLERWPAITEIAAWWLAIGALLALAGIGLDAVCRHRGVKLLR